MAKSKPVSEVMAELANQSAEQQRRFLDESAQMDQDFRQRNTGREDNAVTNEIERSDAGTRDDDGSDNDAVPDVDAGDVARGASNRIYRSDGCRFG